MPFLVILIVALLTPCLFARDGWANFSTPFPIHSAELYGDGVFLATDGGVRYRTVDDDILYLSVNGLETSSFYAVAKSSEHLYAVSRYGLIAQMNDSYAGWKVINRSFLENDEELIADMALIEGNVMVLAFSSRLAFVDLESGNSILSLDRIGDESLSRNPLVAISILEGGDSLLAVTEHGSFIRHVDFSRITLDRQLPDPTQWMRSSRTIPARDSVHVYVDGKSLANSLLYADGKSRVLWNLKGEKATFLVGTDLVCAYSGGKLKDLTKYAAYGLGGAYELRSSSYGGVVAANSEGRIAYGNGYGWQEPVAVFNCNENNCKRNEPLLNRLKVLSVIGDGSLIFHVWGLGLFGYNEFGNAARYFVVPSEDNCMDQFISGFTVVVGTAVAPDNSGFLVSTAAEDGYGLVYVTKEGEISCAKNVGSTSYSGPIAARYDSTSSEWVIYSAYRDEGFGAFQTGELDVFTAIPPSKNGGRLEITSRKVLHGVDNSIVDMALDERNGIVWLVTSSHVTYLDIDADTIRKPTSMNGLLGAEYTSVDVDVQGNVWLGTSNQGAYRLKRTGKSNDTLSVLHFTSKDGLLGDDVLDVSIDSTFGMAWFAHGNGISRYIRNDLRKSVPSVSEKGDSPVVAYPNPFRPRSHGIMTIDNVTESSRVDIYNRGASLVRSFSGDDVLGGKVEWDGLSGNGDLVAPGVYYYVVRDGSKKAKGKIIVIH